MTARDTILRLTITARGRKKYLPYVLSRIFLPFPPHRHAGYWLEQITVLRTYTNAAFCYAHPVTENYFPFKVILLYKLFVTQLNSSHRHGVDNRVIFQMIPGNLVISCNVLSHRCSSYYNRGVLYIAPVEGSYLLESTGFAMCTKWKEEFFRLFFIGKLGARTSKI